MQATQRAQLVVELEHRLLVALGQSVIVARLACVLTRHSLPVALLRNERGVLVLQLLETLLGGVEAAAERACAALLVLKVAFGVLELRTQALQRLVQVRDAARVGARVARRRRRGRR